VGVSGVAKLRSPSSSSSGAPRQLDAMSADQSVSAGEGSVGALVLEEWG
jgi:hypothetical protein